MLRTRLDALRLDASDQLVRNLAGQVWITASSTMSVSSERIAFSAERPYPSQFLPAAGARMRFLHFYEPNDSSFVDGRRDAICSHHGREGDMYALSAELRAHGLTSCADEGAVPTAGRKSRMISCSAAGQ